MAKKRVNASNVVIAKKTPKKKSARYAESIGK